MCLPPWEALATSGLTPSDSPDWCAPRRCSPLAARSSRGKARRPPQRRRRATCRRCWTGHAPISATTHPQPCPPRCAGATVPAAQVETLIAERHLRMLPGTRVTPDETSATGLVAVYADDLDDPARIGDRRVDPLEFAARHPSARLTVAGDVVFRTAPTPRAWVDPDGSKVVVHPARVLRINSGDPGGLVPELVAADIDRSSGGPGAWRRWRLRRVAPHVVRAAPRRPRRRSPPAAKHSHAASRRSTPMPNCSPPVLSPAP